MPDRQLAEPVAEENTLTGEWPSEADLFYKELGRENSKGQLAYLRDLLHKFVTLDAALMAAMLVFTGRPGYPAVWGVLVFVAFLGSLGVALFGLVPQTYLANWMAPDLVRRNVRRAVVTKWRCLAGSAALLGVGFLLALAGLIVQAAGG